MALIISVSQSKGGSTKTTTAVNLCGALLEKGYRAIVADMDKDKPDAINWAHQSKGLGFVIELFDEKPMDKLEELKQQYDVIILDTPPNYMPAAFKAIILSDFVLLPCSPSFLDQNNLADAVSIPKMAKKPFRILGTKVIKRQKLSEQLVKELKQSELALHTFITSKTVVLEAPFKGQWIGSYQPGSDSHKEFLALADEILDLPELQSYFHNNEMTASVNDEIATVKQAQVFREVEYCSQDEVVEDEDNELEPPMCKVVGENAQHIVWDNGSN